MPRRSSASTRSSAPAPSRNLPAHQPQAPPPQIVMQPAQKQPGLFAQMATTAAGVAVGSAVGHTIGAAITGGIGGSGSQQAPAPVQQQAPQQYQQQAPQQQQNPCWQQLQQFLECSSNQADLSLCQGFNDALRDCKTRYGVY